MASAFEKGIQFTDGQYLSKEELQAHFNLDDVESLWSGIQEYRSLFREDLPARSTSGLPYYVVLTRDLALRLARDEGRLYRALVASIRLHPAVISRLRFSSLCSHLELISTYYDLGVTRPQIEALVDGKPSDDLKTGLLFNFAKEVAQLWEEPTEVNPDFADGINASLLNEELDKVKAQPSRIQPLFRILESEEQLPLLMRFLLVFFWFSSAQPYEFYCELTSAFLAEAYLADKGFEFLPFCLNLSSLYLNKNQELIKSTNLAIKTRDVTYYIRTALPLFEESLEQLEADLERAKRENAAFISPNRRPVPVLGRAGRLARQAKPEEPVSDDRANQLLQAYPVLRPFQVEFYLNHCRTGEFYTLRQFQEAERVVYETARTSMELLANLGFYHKTKSGKKFTYTPIPRTQIEGKKAGEQPSEGEEEAKGA